MRIVAYCCGEAECRGDAGAELFLLAQQVYVDGEAGSEGRSGRDRLLADLHTHPTDLVLVPELGHLGDDAEAVSGWIEAIEATGAEVISIAGGAVDFDSLRRGVDLAARQRQHRLRQGHARRRLQALPPPGKAPYGYRRGQHRYLIDRTTAPVVAALVNEFLLYGSLRGAVRFIETRLGKRVSASTGRRWLTHPAYRGDLQYADGTVLRDTHAAIVSREEAAQIDRLLRRNRPLPPRTAGAPRSLAGLVVCGDCNQRLTVSKTAPRGQAKSYLYLRPSGCPRQPRCPALPYDEALGQIVAEICRVLPQAVGQLSARLPADAPAPGAQLQHQIDAREAVLAQLPDLEEAGILDGETAALRRYRLRGEVAELHRQLAQLPPVNLQELSQSVSIPQFWLDLSEAERRFFFREFIREIQVVRRGDQWQIELGLVF